MSCQNGIDAIVYNKDGFKSDNDSDDSGVSLDFEQIKVPIKDHNKGRLSRKGISISPTLINKNKVNRINTT